MKKLSIVTLVSTLTLAAILFSCSGDDAVTPAPSNLVSGVFLGDTIPINDTLMLRVDLSVDEQADGTVNGGLWITWRYTTQRAHRERVLHNLTFTRMPDDETVHFSGTASIDHPAGEVHISGNIVSESVIEYSVTFADGRGVAGRMNRRGPFLKPSDSKSTLDSVSDNVGTYPALWGKIYPDSCCDLPLSYGQLVVTSATVNNVGTIDLEGTAYGWYSYCPCFQVFQPGDTCTCTLPWDDSSFEIQAGVLYINFEFDEGNLDYLVGSQFWNPSEKMTIINNFSLWTIRGYAYGTTEGYIGPKE